MEQLLYGDQTEEAKVEFLEASKKLDGLLLNQEIFWHQRSKVSCLKHGDKNSIFFHSKATQRQRINFIHGLCNDQQQWVERIEDIADVATDYFDTFFNSKGNGQMDDYLNTVNYGVTPKMLEELSRDYTAKEIKAALFQMGPTKAPGLDGMNALFYQKFWHIVGTDVVAVVLDFVHSGTMPFDINYTHIFFIPKVKSPENLSDYRPISLCTVIYKIISKILANRLKIILP